MPLILWAYLGYVAGLLVGFSGSGRLVCTVIIAAVALAMWYRSGGVSGAVLFVFVGIIVTSSGAPTVARPYVGVDSDTTTFLGRQRGRAERAIDSVFLGDAPIVRALLIADKGALPYAMKQRYVAAGIAHRLSISGLHVAVIAMAIEMLCLLLRTSRRITTLASVAGIIGYVALLGFPIPAMRAGAMFGILRLSRLFQRPTSPWAILAVCGFLPLFDPSTVLTVSYQLNMVGVASFMAATTLARRLLRKETSPLPMQLVGWRKRLVKTILISTVATAITGPLIAWWFGQISLIAPVTNLIVEPLFEFVQPLLFLGVLFAPLHTIATIFADAAHPILSAINYVTVVAVRIPYASVSVKPTILEGILTGITAATTLTACVIRSPTRPLLIGAAALCTLVCIN